MNDWSDEKKKSYAEFCAFVKTNLGDIPVMDRGRHISTKISNYWLLWQEATMLANNKANRVIDDLFSDKPF